jgi:serine/threonine protein kinase
LAPPYENRVTSPSSPPNGTELKGGRYTLVRRLGEGSQGETYEARDNGIAPARPRPEALVEDFRRYVARARDGETPTSPASREMVAIKCFRVGKAKAWKDVELAEREAHTLASLDHPRLPRYIEHFEEDGALYLVMEKVEGESLAALRNRRDRQRTLDIAEVTRMLEDIGDALRYLHGRAPFIVHRDIKPGNVIRRLDGSYALVDFGAVRDRLRPAGGSTVVGTFGYMAPEQFQGRASPKSDVYGLGATAIAMLTGCEPEDLPHEGLGIDVARALPKGTPSSLVRALTSMLQPDPDRRADSVDDALAFLHATKKPEPQRKLTAPPPATLTRKQKRELKHQSKRAAREERRRRREAARARRPPFVPRLVAKLGVLVAMLVVWVTVGLVVPLVLGILSLLFGNPLRRAARSCVNAAKKSQAALGRASSWLSGYREEADTEAARVRVAADLDRVRAVTDTEARGEEADEWLEERLAQEREHAELEQERERQLRRTASPHSVKRRP